jgi:predicted DNA binding CopG/RHH family protein
LEPVDELFVLSPALAQRIRDRAKKRMISIRLAQWQIEKSKHVAKTLNIPYQTLLRRWIDEGLRAAFIKHRPT